MPRPANDYGPHIEKRGNRFFAILKVPEDAQQFLTKRNGEPRKCFIEALAH
jgi:hypothetical protein